MTADAAARGIREVDPLRFCRIIYSEPCKLITGYLTLSSFARATSTRQLDSLSTRSATLAMKKRENAPRPRVPITIRSASLFHARPRLSCLQRRQTAPTVGRRYQPEIRPRCFAIYRRAASSSSRRTAGLSRNDDRRAANTVPPGCVRLFYAPAQRLDRSRREVCDTQDATERRLYFFGVVRNVLALNLVNNARNSENRA